MSNYIRLDHATISPEQVKFGMWYTICCYQDLTEINNQEELDFVVESLVSLKEDVEDGDITLVGLWDTREQALRELLDWSKDEEEKEEIQKVLSELPPDKEI